MQLMIKCPYHQDDTASCSVDPDAGVFICFGCRKSGLTYDLVRDMGLTIPEAMDRELVKTVLKKRSVGTSTGMAMGLPTFAPHRSEQIQKMWLAARPSSFGLGWALHRASSQTLMGYGVDYVSGLVCFRRQAGYMGHWSDELGQVREAREGGQYYSLGACDRFRCEFIPGIAQPFRHVLMVEGPFDALRILEALGNTAVNRYGLVLGVCGGTHLPNPARLRTMFPDAIPWTMFDNDEAGIALRHEAFMEHGFSTIRYEGEDPGSARMSDLYDAITSHLT